MTDQESLLQERLNELLDKRDAPKTICPSEVPRSLSSADIRALGASEWRELMPRVREILWEMRDRGEVEIMQRGEPIAAESNLEDIRGPIRARRPCN